VSKDCDCEANGVECCGDKAKRFLTRLLYFGWHKYGCAMVRYDNSTECTCGYMVLLEEILAEYGNPIS
jgi:hypothetical protein